jgi:RNase H-like domain found in reverse transcriptase/Reverse transcriptase (RNA-dependent DNA polymerase)/Integrase zinc binding domain/Retroviral aspartyl protease/Zinc knuckle
MATRTYALRSRADAGIDDQPRAQNDLTTRQSTPPPSRDLPPHMSGRLPFSGTIPALYSEVVSPRTPSPLRENSSETVLISEGDPFPGRAIIGRTPPVITVVPTDSRENENNFNENISSNELTSPKDPGSEHWTTVRRRRARSLETNEGVPAMEAADMMTAKQKKALKEKQKVITHQDDSSPSRGEGASRPKGKGIDPREWGNVNISLESLDIEAQAAAYRSILQERQTSKRQNADTSKRTHQAGRRNHRSPSARLPAASRPVAQLAQGSYLGMALRNIGRSVPEKETFRYGKSSPPPPEPGSPDDEPSGSEGGSRSWKTRKRRDNRHGRNGRRRRSSSSSSSNRVIKPIAPKEYNGGADARSYHRFVRESEAYLRDGKVKGQRQIFLLSYYLTDKAYDFYTQKVANDEENWTLSEFYSELFNYCFPVDYRMQLRKTLARCYQNEKSVAEYTHELNELFKMIGDIPERDQVLKFWNGSRPIIQKGLWRDNLNPETSSWARVVAQAEIIEISENVAERRDRRAGSSSQQAGPSGGPVGRSNRSKNRNATENSVRSVSYENRAQTHPRSGSRSHQRSNHSSDSRATSSRGRESSYPQRGGYAPRGRSQTPRMSTPMARITPRLSDKEKAERLAAGQCFNCGGADHFSRNCPTKGLVRSSGGKPPGASSFNIEPVITEDDSDGVEVLDSLPVGALFFNAGDGFPELVGSANDEEMWTFHPLSEWREHYPYWGQPDIWARRQIGDCYVMVADSILTLQQPYPGDDRYLPSELRPEMRFDIIESGSEYRIFDSLVRKQVRVDSSLLKRPCFNLGRWYAMQRVKALQLSKTEAHLYDGPMGPAVCNVAQKLLTDGINAYYPCVRPDLDPAVRFSVSQYVGVGNEYVITDKDIRRLVRVSQSLLEDPSFDLVGWYIDFLSQRNLYGRQVNTTNTSSCCESNHQFVGCIGDIQIDEQSNLEPTSESPPALDEPEYDDLPGLEPVTDDSDDEESEDDLPGLNPVTDDSEDEGSDSEYDDLPGLNPVTDDSDDEDSGSDGLDSTAKSFHDLDEPDYNDLPDLIPLADDSDDGNSEVGSLRMNDSEVDDLPDLWIDVLMVRLAEVLSNCQPFPGDGPAVDPTYCDGDDRFVIARKSLDVLEVYDRVQGFEAHIAITHLQWERFSVGKWFAERCAFNSSLPRPWVMANDWLKSRNGIRTTMGFPALRDNFELFARKRTCADAVDLGGVQVDRNKYPSLQRNSAHIKGNSRILPRPVVVKVEINNHPVRALLDSGSLGDFISSTLVDQLSITREKLDSPLSLHLAVQGSRSKVNARATVNLKYQGINETRTLDVINLNNYDLILGTPWMYQHKICLGFNPARVVVGSDEALPMKAGLDTKLLVSMLTPEEQRIESVREELRQYAEPLCREMAETSLPPLRAINHTIPLIDESKTYSWRPSRCPEALRAEWAEKRDAYLKSGRWKIAPVGNTVPMLLIPKPGTNPPQLRTVVDLRERNKNTHKMTSPLPDMDGMLRRTASKPYRTSLDLKNAYEQIRIIPEHVERSSVTTPDGNMVSLVTQQGDCNAPATHQALMNYLFSSYIGRFLDIYLDDIVIYSDTLDEHVEHVKLVLDILRREKLYLSRSKLRFIEPELKLLGRIIDENGIRMDAEKVDSVVNWKVPTNRDLLRGFIGSVGYLADDIPNVRIPLGILSSITGDTVPFRWGYTEQRAFDEVKNLVHAARNHHRVPLDYSPGAPPIWMITDGCATGISGVISQGPEWKTAKIAAFYSAKLNPAQQNYPVHEIEMLAGIETMLRFKDILQGAQFQWLTDHKGLTHLLNQKNLSGRQARWLEKISSFSFKVVYIAGSENVVADALSRIYSNDSPGTRRSRTEFTYHDVVDDDTSTVAAGEDDIPILAGMEARVATRRGSRVRKMTEKAAWRLTDDASDGVEMSRPGPSRTAVRVKDRGGPQEGGSTPKTPKTPQTLEGTTQTLVVETPVKQAVEIVTPLLTQSSLGIDIVSELRGKYKDDLFFRTILEKPNEFRNFEMNDQLIYLKENDRRVLCVPKVLIQGRNSREIVISEAHSMLAHLGASKTLDYLKDHVWWRDMVTDVKAFCETCQTCKMSKPSNQKPYGLLNPLSVPSYPWESVGIDFVGPLPESRNRDGQYDAITVIICLLTAMVHLIPSRINYNATQLAELVFEHIYKIHGLPRNIISDRDVLFTSAFWSRLHRLIGTKLRMSSAYHPQSDGSTERANRTVTQMLRQCIQPDQKDWVARLPAIEFAINSARSESTGYAPFFLNFGRMPRNMIWNSALRDEYPSVRDFALTKKLALMSAHDSIIAARVKQTRDANRKRQAVPFVLGDLVYLSAKNISFPKGLARKLLPKFIGPYKIVRDFGNSSFQLDLASHLKRRGVHDVFHSSLLRIHLPNDDRLFPGRMDTQLTSVEGDDEWAVDKLLSHHGSGTDATFEVLWKSGDVTWLPYYQITHLQALTDYMELLGVKKIARLPKGIGRPPQDDPQVFVGYIDTSTPPLTVSSFFSSFFSLLHSTSLALKASLHSFASHILPCLRPSFISATIDLEFDFTMPSIQSVNHPLFSRISPTHYLIKNSNGYLSVTLHVGQVADYFNFEERLRIQKDLSNFQSMPLGYLEFADLWNSGVSSNDIRRLSTYSYVEGSDGPVYDLSSTPLLVGEFFITPEQVGLRPPQHQHQPQTPSQPRNEPRQSQDRHYKQRQENRNGFIQRQEGGRGGSSQRQGKRQRYFDYVPVPFGQSETPLSRLRFLARPSAPTVDTTTPTSPVPTSTANSATIEGGSSDVQDAIMHGPPLITDDAQDTLKIIN